MTVRTALALPALRRGLPEVLAGARRLDRTLRWAHAAEVRNIAELLKGGELLLTTGMGWPAKAAEQRRFIGELADREVAALVVELNPTLPAVPKAVVDEAERRGLPLVALRRGVPFVEVTEAIHSEVLAGQLQLLRRGEEIHQRFTDLMLEGEGIDRVLGVLAETIADPVVLEDARGELLFHARHRTHDADVVAAWEALRKGGEGCYAVETPTGDAGGPGRLVALSLDSPLDDFDRVAVDRAAGVIALASLRTNQQQLLGLRERGGFLAELIAGDLRAREAAARAEALSFAPGDAALLPLAIALTPAPRRDTEEKAAALVWRDARRELEGRRLPALFGARPGAGDALALVGVGSGTAAAKRASNGASPAGARIEVAAVAAEAVHHAVEHHFGRSARAIVVAGPAEHGWDEAAEGLRCAANAVPAARRLPARPWHDAAAPDLERLLATLAEDASLREFVIRRLGPLVAHDARRKHRLLPTLEAFCAHGGHKAETARTLHLGRQALYHRLDRIEELLGADLDDEDTRLGLHLALRARRLEAA
jgi:PucR family transcriptional regulator, purine catabolism regulatory protein